MSNGLIYKWVRGYERTKKLLMKLDRGFTPRESGTIMTTGTITAELYCEKTPTDDGYEDYWLVYMEAPREQEEWLDVSGVREKALKELKNGTAKIDR